jgi:folate-binding protein YgfZ
VDDTARRTGLLARLEAPLAPGLLWVEGKDAASFLQGQLGNEVSALLPGEGNETARLTRKGGLLDLLSLHRIPDADPSPLLILGEAERIPALATDLEAFVFSESLELEDRGDDYDLILIEGPAAPALLHSSFGAPPSGEESWGTLPPFSVTGLVGHAARDRTLVLARGLSGRGFIILAPRESGHLPMIQARLAGPAAELGFVQPEGEALAALLEIRRIEAGLPRIGADFEPGARLLPETGLENRFVSFTKGCFLGQEVVARIHNRGSASVVLRGLRLPAGEATLKGLPHAGDALIDAAGATIGEWASRVHSPALDCTLALTYLDRAHRRPGDRLELAGGLSAEVLLPPFVRELSEGASADELYDAAVGVFARGEDRRALALLEEALAADPAHADSWEALGVILGRAGRYEEAIATFRRLEEVAPDEPMVHTNLSLYYMKVGDIEQAEAHRAQATLKQFGALVGEAAAEEMAQAEARAQRTDAERRLTMFVEVLEFDAQDPLALMGAGKALLELERTEEAEARLTRACELQGDNSSAFVLLGQALEKLGRGDEAVDIYRRGIETASRKGDLMPLRKMENRLLLLGGPAEKR